MHAFIKLKLGKFKTTVLRTDGSKLNNPYFLQSLETCAKLLWCKMKCIRSDQSEKSCRNTKWILIQSGKSHLRNAFLPFCIWFHLSSSTGLICWLWNLPAAWHTIGNCIISVSVHFYFGYIFNVFVLPASLLRLDVCCVVWTKKRGL